MNDPVVRAIVVLAILSVVSMVAAAVRRGVVMRRRRVDLPYTGVVLFASDGCESCAQVRENLEAAGVGAVTMIDWDASPQRFLEAGIDRIPTLARLDEDGTGWAVAGVPSVARLRRWLRDP